jgi:Flp pilus assembly protein CpaB
VTVLLVLVLLGAVRALSIRQHLDTQRWGAVRTVVVAKFTFPEGHRLEANDLAERPLPIAALPDQAIVMLEVAKGRTLRAAVTAGQVLTELVIGAPKARALLSSIGANRVAIAIATSGPRPPIQLGDRVDVHSITSAVDQPLDAITAASAESAASVAFVASVESSVGSVESSDSKRLNGPSQRNEGLVVVAVTDQSISVATPASEVPQLVELLRAGPVLIALHGR